jgi:hypothetical protein
MFIMPKKGFSGMMKKGGKRMNFSQSVIGHSAKRTKKPSVGMIVAPSAGTVTKNPPRVKGKRTF